MTKVAFNNRKALGIWYSGRSTDYVAPSFGYGCMLNCTYCYMKRNKPVGLSIAKNTGQILAAINNHCLFDAQEIDKPNQTHPEYITYDIGCNEDFALHLKYHKNWKGIFQFFVDHPRAMGSFATKVVKDELLSFNPQNKMRIRFSLMPQIYSTYLEPRSSSISDRIEAIDKFIEAGYDVHINFSPVIVTDGWLEEYEKLFSEINSVVNYKEKLKCEVIFLTHSHDKHLYNLKHSLPGERLLYKPGIQEEKMNLRGNRALRYERHLKNMYITQFKKLHSRLIDWCDIRYIF